MNPKKFEELFNKWHEDRKKVAVGKSHDYATDEEFLQNFKTMAQLMEILKIDVKTPIGVATFFITMKLARFCNLWFSGKTPKNEAITDTIRIDLPIYTDLLNALMWEKVELPGIANKAIDKWANKLEKMSKEDVIKLIDKTKRNFPNLGVDEEPKKPKTRFVPGSEPKKRKKK